MACSKKLMVRHCLCYLLLFNDGDPDYFVLASLLSFLVFSQRKNSRMVPHRTQVT